MRITIEIDESGATISQSATSNMGTGGVTTDQQIARAIASGGQNAGPAPSRAPSQQGSSAPMAFIGQGVAAKDRSSGAMSAGAAPARDSVS